MNVVLQFRPDGSWPRPHSSNPMFAMVTSAATDGDGTQRVTVRAARTGSATVTWTSDGAAVFTLQLDVAGYPMR